MPNHSHLHASRSGCTTPIGRVRDALLGVGRGSRIVSRRFGAVGLLALVAFGAGFGGLAQPAGAAECKPYIFIGARGSGQADGFGNVVGATEAKLQSLAAGSGLVESIALNTSDGYRAVPVYTDADLAALGEAALTRNVNLAATIGVGRLRSYDSSVADGKSALTSMIERLAGDCPTSKFLLSGYSQGAQVVQDVVQNLGSALRSRIRGVAVFGDPRFNPYGSGTTGTFNPARHGLLGQRPPSTGVATASWCIAGDPVCQNFVWADIGSLGVGGFSVSAHGKYVSNGYADTSGNWMWQLIRKDLKAAGATVPPEPQPSPRALDLSVVVDTTGSMGGAIASVRSNLQAIHDELAAKTTDFRLALTEFKDAGDVFQSQLDLDLTSDPAAFSTALDGLFADGGGDTPESVFAGFSTGLGAVSWRAAAAKAVVLVGDAPPKDPEPDTGLTEADIITQALRVPAPIYALNICCDPDAQAAFARLADGTSGKLLSPDSGAAG